MQKKKWYETKEKEHKMNWSKSYNNSQYMAREENQQKISYYESS